MTESTKNNAPVLGLDVGTSRLVLAEQNGDGFQFRSQLNAFVTIPFSKLTRSVLEKEKVPHAVSGPDIFVFGDEVENFASLFQVETRRPMTRGILNPNENHSHTTIRQLIRMLAGGEPRPGEKIFYSVPAPIQDGEDVTAYHDSVLRQMIEELGYQAESVPEGLAVVYAELESSNYTGVGVSCGGGLCNVCLAYLSVPVFSFSVPKGGDFVDAGAASATGESVTLVRQIKEHDFHLNGFAGDRVQQALTVHYEEMIRAVVEGLKQAFARVRHAPRLNRPIPLALSGGSVMPKGFVDRFARILGSAGLPVEFSQIRVSPDPLHSTAKGVLIAALSQ